MITEKQKKAFKELMVIYLLVHLIKLAKMYMEAIGYKFP